jgi:Deoxyribonuclease NucA/NucB
MKKLPIMIVAFGLAVVASVCFPSPSQAAIPSITSFTASPSTVKVGGSSVISAALSETNPEYDVALFNTDTKEEIGACWAISTPCTQKIEVPWSSNKEPKSLHFVAKVYPDGTIPTEGGGGSTLTVPVEHFDWNISLEVSKHFVSVGETTKITVKGLEPNPAWTGYLTHWVDETTGESLGDCFGSNCYEEFSIPIWMDAEAGAVDIRAEMVYEGDPENVAGVADTTVYVEPIHFGVGWSFSEPENSGGETSWLATITSTPPEYLYGLYTVYVRKQNGELVTTCTLGTCERRFGPGTYRAVVEDEAGDEFAATGWWTIPAGSSAEPEEEAADGLNLVALGAMFTGPSEICTDLLFYPGTHFEGGSVSDQYLDCEASVGKGASTTKVLKEVAAAGAGTSVLWFLYEEKTKELTPAEDMEPLEEEMEPWPVPPVGWPGEVAVEAETLQELNPQLETEREAEVVAKQCRRLVIPASLPTSDCTELPIFASGDLDVPQATQHDIEAIDYYPPWVKLNYESSAGKSGEGWYRYDPVCEEKPKGFDCDEFPFFSTEQGGKSSDPRPSLKPVVKVQNQRQGGKLGAFYARCGVNVRKGRPFLNVPMPPGSNVPTLYLCNGNS